MNVDCADREQDLPKRDRQHPAAGGQDVVRELEHQQQRDRLAVLAQKNCATGGSAPEVLILRLDVGAGAIIGLTS
jgi:hypothetical protein